MASLECPTYEEQEAEWQRILSTLTRDSIERLLLSIDYKLVAYELYEQTSGVINKIYMLNVEDTNKQRQELVLRINNPHKFWRHRRNTNEVAILAYLNEQSSHIVPVPRLLSHSSDSQTSILGCEYMLMNKVPGQTLRRHIETLDETTDLEQKLG